MSPPTTNPPMFLKLLQGSATSLANLLFCCSPRRKRVFRRIKWQVFCYCKAVEKGVVFLEMDWMVTPLKSNALIPKMAKKSKPEIHFPKPITFSMLDFRCVWMIQSDEPVIISPWLVVVFVGDEIGMSLVGFDHCSDMLPKLSIAPEKHAGWKLLSLGVPVTLLLNCGGVYRFICCQHF